MGREIPLPIDYSFQCLQCLAASRLARHRPHPNTGNYLTTEHAYLKLARQILTIVLFFTSTFIST